MSEDTCALTCERNDKGHCTLWAKTSVCQRWREATGTPYPEIGRLLEQVMADTTAPMPTATDTPAMELAELLAKAHWFGYVKPLILAHGAGDELVKVAEFHYISAFAHGFKHGVEDSR